MSVAFDQDGGIGRITLEKPPANSYDLDFMQEFAGAVGQAIGVRRARRGRAVGVGEVLLCRRRRQALPRGRRRLQHGDDPDLAGCVCAIAAAPQVFIAHIAGHALGGGLEIALGCDLRIATAGGYKLGTPEVSLGLLPGNGGTQRLTRMLGTSRATDLLLTGKSFSVEEAHEWGLVAEVFDDNARVQAYVERFAGGPALALRNIKRCVNEGGQLPLTDGLALESRLVEELFRSHDANEGLTAFVEKRTPDFTGA